MPCNVAWLLLFSRFKGVKNGAHTQNFEFLFQVPNLIAWVRILYL